VLGEFNVSHFAWVYFENYISINYAVFREDIHRLSLLQMNRKPENHPGHFYWNDFHRQGL
jgi:hypothetical protein